jgi:predicted transcriptional regulator
MMTGTQMRAARGLLRWSAAVLAEKSGVSQPTIQRMETADGIPHSYFDTLTAVQDTLENAGIEFISENGGGVGVRFRKPENNPESSSA